MKQLVNIFLCLLLLIIFSDKREYSPVVEYENVQFIHGHNKFVAGELIKLSFKGGANATLLLFIQSSYGTSVLTPIFKDGTSNFVFPAFISEKMGLINWQLSNNQSMVLSGYVEVLSNMNNIFFLENYCGPPSIQAGSTDFSMLVAVATDRFDNPLTGKNTLQFSSFYNNKYKVENIQLEQFIAWKRYYSHTETGLYLMSTKFRNTSSKEVNVFIKPSFPKNFKITLNTAHFFADGNQLLELTSSAIKDIYNNIVADGTLINFVITSNSKQVLMVQGTTIRGVAKAKIIHPEIPSTWSIRAYVDGISTSNEISLTFKPALLDVNYSFNRASQELIVGPLHSFIDQLMPDGISVYLYVYLKNKHIKTIKKRTFRGVVSFDGAIFDASNKNYNFRIETMGLKKEILLY
ncbi:MAG: hypothetical protein COB81_01980 [Flavobacteriaceae bacterium]|nr:MAG: hypothetical protein COB81_01980 [Flavobacteriaceae bacterium]